MPSYRSSFHSDVQHGFSFPSSSNHAKSSQVKQSLSKPILVENNLNQSPISSHLDIGGSLLDEDEAKLLTSVEIIDEQGNVIRTQRMSVTDVWRLKEGEIVLVPFNEVDQPLKAARGLCTRFMTLLLKKQNLCPPEVKDWREIKKRCGVRLMAVLRSKFVLPQRDSVDGVIFSIFGDKFRTLKYQLRIKLFELAAEILKEVDNNRSDDVQQRHYTEEELLQGLDLMESPFNFLDHKWELYKSHLRTSKAKMLSQNGKKARAEQLHIRTTGSV